MKVTCEEVDQALLNAFPDGVRWTISRVASSVGPSLNPICVTITTAPALEPSRNCPQCKRSDGTHEPFCLLNVRRMPS